MQDEFYIGWQADTPPSFAKVVRRFVTGLCVLLPLIAILIAGFQTGFSNGTFEFGKTTVLEGIFSEDPVPFISVENGKDAVGNPVFQKILLVGEGKFGFDGHSLRGQKIRIAGTLIYNDGKTAFQVESVDHQEPAAPQPLPSARLLGPSVSLRGEITDPKCLLGVMNPGRGKPHRDCAVRCIAGGIPPLLKVTGAGGETEYYLLTNADGSPINDRILEFVGDGVQMCGQLVQEADWLLLRADPASIRRIHKEALETGNQCSGQ